MEQVKYFDCVVIGGSWGGIEAVSKILAKLPNTFPIPIIVVLHQHRNSMGHISEIFGRGSSLPVKEADEKEFLEGGHVYVAPPNYHLLVEKDHTLSLSVEDHVHFSRPSIDVSFASAAEIYRDALIGVLLTGANQDGAVGIEQIKRYGGFALAEDPETAKVATMPRSAIERTQVDQVLDLDGIADYLISITLGPSAVNQK